MATLPTLYEHYTSGGITAGLSAAQPHFTLNDRNVTLYSGALHYFRVPQEYWRDRLRKMRAAGLNTVETYVPWNLHEPEPGVYDFGNGGSDYQQLLDIEKFLKTAQEEDLFAIVRPGPYICAEWEFGGLPSWLLREEDIKVRTSQEPFFGHVKRYFSALLSILTLLQFTKGGPIIAFQIENEYGSTKENSQPIDVAYLQGLRDTLQENGINELLFTSDMPSMGKWGWIPDVLYTANFQGNPENELTIMQEYQPGRPSMVMEYWSGWFDHWTEHHNTRSTKSFSDIYERVLKFPASINIYMFHGGTSWGFLSGANLNTGHADNRGFQPDTTSYDYDAPLTEAGDYGEKYFAVKSLIEKYNKIQTRLPALPEPMKRIAYNKIAITEQLTLQELLSQSEYIVESNNLVPMELLPINNNAGQRYGYIIYRKQNINIPANSTLKISGRVCDTVMVLINGKLVSKVIKAQKDLQEFGYWKLKDSTLNLGPTEFKDATLELVVENWGRVGFGWLYQFNQYKGLWQGNVSINGNDLFEWEMIPLEFKTKWTNDLKGWHSPNFTEGPAIYKGILEVSETRDTYIDMRGWNKGLIIVNGFVLSRHFRIGPQQAAYFPAPFQKVGKNEIVIFEHFHANKYIEFLDNPMFETLP